MIYSARARYTLSASLVIALLAGPVWSAQRDQDKKPSLSLKVNPPVGFSPLRVRAAVEVRGGPDDYAEFYCPAVEWDWGDGTVSENSSDCDPYEVGKSEIPRHFSADHIYRLSGAFKVAFRLKQKTKLVGMTTVNVQVRPGSRDDF